jgi:hypothetical protein
MGFVKSSDFPGSFAHDGIVAGGHAAPKAGRQAGKPEKENRVLMSGSWISAATIARFAGAASFALAFTEGFERNHL